MKTLLAHRYIIRENFLLIIGICLCAYFSYHALQGQRSVVRLMSLGTYNEKMLEEISNVKNKRHLLEGDVAMLRPNALDKDFLEERVRIVLGYRSPSEHVIVAN